MGKAACMQLPFYVCISRHIQMPSLKKDIWRALGLFYMRRNKKIIVILHKIILSHNYLSWDACIKVGLLTLFYVVHLLQLTRNNIYYGTSPTRRMYHCWCGIYWTRALIQRQEQISCGKLLPWLMIGIIANEILQQSRQT